MYKPTNNNLRTSSNTRNTNVDNTSRTKRGTGYDRQTGQYDNQRAINVARARENVEQDDWHDGTNDEHEDQELEAHYMYMAKIQDVIPDTAVNSGSIFNAEPPQTLHNDVDDYNVKNQNILLESSNKALIEKLKCEIDDSQNRNKLLKSSNKAFKEVCKELGDVNKLMSKDLDKFQIKLDRYRNVNFVKDVENESAKAYGLLAQQKVNSEKSFNDYNQKIFKLNKKISEIEKELIAHQKTISTLLHEKESQEKFYKTREEKEIEKVICLENQVNVLDNIVYKTGQSVQTMNMLNRNCKTSFVKPEFLKKAIRVNPRLYDIGCYNDNLALMLAPASNETIHLAQESRSKLKEMVDDLKYFNSLEKEVESLQFQLETQKTQFSNEIDRLSREYYYADHMNDILGVYTKLDEFTDLQCDYLDK
ncbi:hypothetical protein Tco_1166794 [Tanacetum coccineum]